MQARKKLEEQKAIQTDRFQFFEQKSPETIKVIIDEKCSKDIHKCKKYNPIMW